MRDQGTRPRVKTIERQIRNHEFEIRFEDVDDTGNGKNYCEIPTYRIDGVGLHRGDFEAALALLTAEGPYHVPVSGRFYTDDPSQLEDA